MKIRNPRTGEDDYEIAPLDQRSVAFEAQRLRKGQVYWSAKTPKQRGEVLIQWAHAIEASMGNVIPALTADTGRAGISKIEAASVPAQIRRWAEQAPQLIAAGQPSC